MTDVLEARRAYKQADDDAVLMKYRARAQLGLACNRAMENDGATLRQLGDLLDVVPEQIRRYRQAYKDWQRDHPDEPLT